MTAPTPINETRAAVSPQTFHDPNRYVGHHSIPSEHLC